MTSKKVPVWKTNALDRKRKMKQLAKALHELMQLEIQDIYATVNYEAYLEGSNLRDDDGARDMFEDDWKEEMLRAGKLRMLSNSIQRVLISEKNTIQLEVVKVPIRVDDPDGLPF